MRCPSVRPFITFMNSVKTSNRIFKVFSPAGSQTTLVFPYQTAWQYSDGDPLTAASNAGGIGTNRDRRIAGYRSIAGCAINSCDGPSCSLSRRRRRISESFSSQPAAWMNTPKRTELIVRSGKFEAEVTNTRRRSGYRTAEANYRQRRSNERSVCDSRATCAIVYLSGLSGRICSAWVGSGSDRLMSVYCSTVAASTSIAEADTGGGAEGCGFSKFGPQTNSLQ